MESSVRVGTGGERQARCDRNQCQHFHRAEVTALHAVAREEGAVVVRDAVEPPSETTAERSRRPRFGRALDASEKSLADQADVRAIRLPRRGICTEQLFGGAWSFCIAVLQGPYRSYGAARRFRTSCPIGARNRLGAHVSKKEKTSTEPRNQPLTMCERSPTPHGPDTFR
jgi:hypothetical protein